VPPESLRSPLSFVVLALLYEAPAHPYRMQHLIRERGKDRVVNVAQRNSVQQTVNRLARDGLIETDGRQDGGTYPARTVYRITRSGTALLFRWLEDMLARPAPEHPRFPAALAFLALTDPPTVLRLLDERRTALLAHHDELATAHTAASEHLARVLLIEDEYALAMIRAELDWLEATIAGLRDGTLTWDTSTLTATEGRAACRTMLSDRLQHAASEERRTPRPGPVDVRAGRRPTRAVRTAVTPLPRARAAQARPAPPGTRARGSGSGGCRTR
jgi:DNA-binding PadR family transcriptional regulator